MQARVVSSLLLGAALWGVGICPGAAQSVSAPVFNPENGHW